MENEEDIYVGNLSWSESGYRVSLIILDRMVRSFFASRVYFEMPF